MGVLAMALQRRRCADAGAMLDIRRPAWFDHPRCRESATYVHDPGRCKPPAGRRRNRSVPGCVVRSYAVRSSPADRKREGVKKFCCVTTRRRKFRGLNILGHGLGPLTARFLCLGMLGFGRAGLATFRLSPSRLPAVDLSHAFGVLTVALVPTSRVVLATALLIEAGSLARTARSGFGTAFFFNVVVAHGRFDLPGKARGGCANILPGRYQNSNKTLAYQSIVFSRTRQRNKRSHRRAGNKNPKRCLPNDRLLESKTER
jgi:hypothetical protein